jgi:hypothetical protein
VFASWLRLGTGHRAAVQELGNASWIHVIDLSRGFSVNLEFQFIRKHPAQFIKMGNKRKKSEITAARKDLRRQALQLDCRSLSDARDKVLHLHSTYEAKETDLQAVTGVPVATISRWIKEPKTARLPGRPPYLPFHLENKLFCEIVPQRYDDHMPMNNAEILAEVRSSIV